MIIDKKKKQFDQLLGCLKLKTNSSDNSGFTLIELMIALAVFTIGISAALGLALSNYNNSRDNLDKIVAVNLAREGIELIRNVRDSNWLRVDNNALTCSGVCTWDYGLSVNSNYIYIDYNDPIPTAAFAGSCALGSNQCVLNCPGCVLYKDTNGFYNNDGIGSATNYSRALKIEKICVDEAVAQPEDNEHIYNMDLSCAGNETYIGVQVTSHVQWQDGGTKSVEITDKFYNWRR